MWIVRPREHKDGFFRLCAESDEGGGFYEGCQHKHETAEQASACLEAKISLGGCTGFAEEGISLAESAYNAYAAQAGWKSLATEQSLPRWNALSVSIKAGWLAAARAVESEVLAAAKERI